MVWIEIFSSVLFGKFLLLLFVCFCYYMIVLLCSYHAKFFQNYKPVHFCREESTEQQFEESGGGSGRVRFLDSVIFLSRFGFFERLKESFVFTCLGHYQKSSFIGHFVTFCVEREEILCQLLIGLLKKVSVAFQAIDLEHKIRLLNPWLTFAVM